MNIKKKLIAISLVCAMSLAATACTDKPTDSASSSLSSSAEANNNNNNNNNNVNAGNLKVQESFSPEEIEQLQKYEMTFSPDSDGDGISQDPVENLSGDNNGGQSDNSTAPGGEIPANANANGNGNGDSSDAEFVPGGNDGNGGGSNGGDSNGGGNSGGGNNNGGSNVPADNGLTFGTKEVYKMFWMDLSKKQDFVFDGEFITVDFKIKEDAPAGKYPITVEWMDFSNYSPSKVEGMTGVSGYVTVGSEAEPNSFKNGGNFEIMAENVSGNPGDTVTVRFMANNNPGFVACFFKFAYDSDVLEFVRGNRGSDFAALM